MITLPYALAQQTHAGRLFKIKAMNTTHSGRVDDCIPGSSPCHCEGSEIRYSQRFRDVITSHSTRTLDQDICTLTCVPRSCQQII